MPERFTKKRGRARSGQVMHRGDWRPSNRTEAQCFARIKRKGYRVLKKGWPDFLVVRPDGEIACVEVKRSKDDLPRPEQRIVLRALARAGIPVYIWSPDRGYRRIRSNPAAAGATVESRAPRRASGPDRGGRGVSRA